MSVKEVFLSVYTFGKPPLQWLLRVEDSDRITLVSRSPQLRVVLDGGMHLRRHVQ